MKIYKNYESYLDLENKEINSIINILNMILLNSQKT